MNKTKLTLKLDVIRHTPIVWPIDRLYNTRDWMRHSFMLQKACTPKALNIRYSFNVLKNGCNLDIYHDMKLRKATKYPWDTIYLPCFLVLAYQ